MDGAVSRAFQSVCIIGANVCVGGAWLYQPPVHDVDIPVCRCTVDVWSGEGCGDSCLNRHMRYECVPGCCQCGSQCCNRQLQVGSSLQTAVVDCGEKGVGLITLEAIRPGRLVGEYVGEVISWRESQQRNLIYQHEKHDYMLRVSSDRVVDATRFGGLMRFVNNSCSPNCKIEKWSVRGEERCGVFAALAIAAGEELTIDYQFEGMSNRDGELGCKCLCGSSNCRGVIGSSSRQTTEATSGRSDISTSARNAMVQLTLDRFMS